MPGLDIWKGFARDAIDGFLRSGMKNTHLHISPVKAYCRISNRLIGPMLDIASVDVEEDSQRNGYFRCFLGQAELKAAQYKMGIYVENALNPILHEALERRGYHETKHVPLCFYKSWPELL